MSDQRADRFDGLRDLFAVLGFGLLMSACGAAGVILSSVAAVALAVPAEAGVHIRSAGLLLGVLAAPVLVVLRDRF